MAWEMSGRGMEMCSCKQFCPCWLGPEGVPDEDWCSGMFGFDVHHGTSDGVDLGGTKAVLMAHWPGNFFGGQGTARLYIDEGASEEQRRELEAIFGGKKEGFLSDLWGAVIEEWLPSQSGNIEIGWDGNSSIKVNGIGEATLEPVSDGAGKLATISGAPAQAGLHIDSMNIATPRNSRWKDPGLREWQPADGVLFDFNWSS